MNHQQAVRIMRGEATGPGARIARGLMSIAEPAYASVVKLRNWMFDAGIRKPHRLPRPVISIGNLTTGGTGKTPLVSHVIRHLVAQGHHPAVLMRGYKSVDGKSDEAQELIESFGVAAIDKAFVIANPRRYEAGLKAIADHPEIDVFVLDDGFQHRQLHRQLNIVLLSATDPFGLDHVLPRGLLREPIEGLQRADLVIITRSDLVDEAALAKIQSRVRSAGCKATICQARHRLTGLRSVGCSAGSKPDMPLDFLRTEKFFAFAGIGQPKALESQLRRLAGDHLVGVKWLEDHHPYTEADYHQIAAEAASLGATHLLTTEKDFVKLMPPAHPVPSPEARPTTNSAIEAAHAQAHSAPLDPMPADSIMDAQGPADRPMDDDLTAGPRIDADPRSADSAPAAAPESTDLESPAAQPQASATPPSAAPLSISIANPNPPPAIPHLRLYRLGLEFEFPPEDEGRFWTTLKTVLAAR